VKPNPPVHIDRLEENRFDGTMKPLAGLLAALFLLGASLACAADEARQLTKVEPLPKALSDNFQFRKTKLFSLGVQAAPHVAETAPGKKKGTGSRSTTVVAEASLNFEQHYRLFGAVTQLDQHQRFGNYFDFFWAAKRDADVTVRLEYRQEKLRSFVQAREIRYPGGRGHHKTEFAIVGDDYFDDGRVIAWRCLLITKGHIVAENRSYLWR
jgi:hypothetical protein